MKVQIKLYIALIVAMLIFPVIVLAQDQSTAPFQLQDYLLSLVGEGGIAMLVSGWMSAQWTKFSGWLMIAQTFVVAIALTMLSSLVGIIAAPIGETWMWFRAGLGNGVLAMILYKTGIFNSVLEMLKARTAHQLETP